MSEAMWREYDDYVFMVLKEPYWSAWKKYGWQKGLCGFGVSLEMIKYAQGRQKDIVLQVGDYGVYRISSIKAIRFLKNEFTAGVTKLLVIPKIAFERVDVEKKAKSEKKDRQQSLL